MCLILLAWRSHAEHPLIVAANRDEFHARPARPAAFWDDSPAILAGRDMEAMGTWMGVARSGRFAAVTNYRGAREPRAVQSRGALVTGFLTTGVSPQSFIGEIQKQLYSGFNLLLADGNELWWFSNRDGTPRRLEPGVYGLGNLLLDSPEVEPDKARFREALEPAPAPDPLFAALAPARILNPDYGTRCSTVLLESKDRRIFYAERGFSSDGAEGDTVQFEFTA